MKLSHLLMLQLPTTLVLILVFSVIMNAAFDIPIKPLSVIAGWLFANLVSGLLHILAYRQVEKDMKKTSEN